MHALKPRLLFTPLAALLGAFILYLAIAGIGRADEPPTVIPLDRTVDGLNVEEWAAQADRWHRVAARYRRQAHLRWQPTVTYALRLASAVYRVPVWQLRHVSWCESRYYVFARNGGHLGIFQLGWKPFGLSPFDPVANALSAAATVRHDRGWSQWNCKP